MDDLPPDPMQSGTIVVVFNSETGQACIAQIVAWLVRSERYRVKIWNAGRQKWANATVLPAGDILGTIPDYAMASVDQLLRLTNYRRNAQVAALDRVARRLVMQTLENYTEEPAQL
jgi:hypothetical protein